MEAVFLVAQAAPTAWFHRRALVDKHSLETTEPQRDDELSKKGLSGLPGVLQGKEDGLLFVTSHCGFLEAPQANDDHGPREAR